MKKVKWLVLALLALLVANCLLIGCAAMNTTYKARDPEVDADSATIMIVNESDWPVFVAQSYAGHELGGLDFTELLLKNEDLFPGDTLWPGDTLNLHMTSITDKRRNREVIYVRWCEEDFSLESHQITIPIERTTRYSVPLPIFIDNATLFGRTLQSVVVFNDTQKDLDVSTTQGHSFFLAAGKHAVISIMPHLETTFSWTTSTRPSYLIKPSKKWVFNECPGGYFNDHWYGAVFRIYNPGPY